MANDPLFIVVAIACLIVLGILVFGLTVFRRQASKRRSKLCTFTVELSLFRVDMKEDQVNTLFLFYFLDNSRARQKYVFKHVTRSTISGINNKGLNEIQLYLPPSDIQDEFEARVLEIESQKSKAKSSSREIRTRDK